MRRTSGISVALAGMAIAWSICAAANDDDSCSLLSMWREPVGEWRMVGDADKNVQDGRKLSGKEGTQTILNGDKGRSKDLVTKQEFGDVELHIEFIIPEKSNSGVYVMGRYEIQIYDSFGVTTNQYPGIECGGIYPRWINGKNLEGHSPAVNAALPPGQWQTFDITFRAPRFDEKGNKTANAVFEKVTHNGKVIHNNVQLTGPTRGGYDGEKTIGPLRLQGDHGPVAFRNIRIKPLPASKSAEPNPFFAMDTCKPGDQLDLLKTLGYTGFSWMPSADMKAKIDGAHERGLKIVALFTGSMVRKDKFEGDQAALITSLKNSETVVWLTINSDAFKVSDEAGDELAVPALQAMADHAAGNNVRIALYPHTGLWVEKIQDAVRLAKKVNRPNFGVTFNLCHCLMIGDEEKIPELLTDAARHLFLVTINGADTRAMRTTWNRLIRPLDEGTFDLLPMLKKLRELGYTGPIGLQGFAVETPPRENLTRSWQAWQKYNERITGNDK